MIITLVVKDRSLAPELWRVSPIPFISMVPHLRGSRWDCEMTSIYPACVACAGGGGGRGVVVKGMVWRWGEGGKRGWEGEGRRCGIEVGEKEGRGGACREEKMESTCRGGGGK